MTRTLKYCDGFGRYIEKETVWPMSFLSNVDFRFRKYVTQAAKNTGFDVYWDWNATDYLGRKVKGCVAVHTRQGGKDHGQFWKEYSRLTGEEKK